MGSIDPDRVLARVRLRDGSESCQVQVYLTADLSLSAKLEFTEGSADDAGALNSVTTSLPESGAAFIQGFVAAVVRQKEADGFEVVTTFFAGQMDSDYAFDLEGKPPPSAEGAAGALCTEASEDEQATQRHSQEPKGQTSIQELARYFHLPINVAGSRLGICPTVLKKICRKHGLSRWPHRKLRSIDRLLEKLRASVDQADKPFGSSMHTRNLRNRIRDLVQERQEICFEARQL